MEDGQEANMLRTAKELFVVAVIAGVVTLAVAPILVAAAGEMILRSLPSLPLLPAASSPGATLRADAARAT